MTNGQLTDSVVFFHNTTIENSQLWLSAFFSSVPLLVSTSVIFCTLSTWVRLQESFTGHTYENNAISRCHLCGHYSLSLTSEWLVQNSTTGQSMNSTVLSRSYLMYITRLSCTILRDCPLKICLCADKVWHISISQGGVWKHNCLISGIWNTQWSVIKLCTWSTISRPENGCYKLNSWLLKNDWFNALL